MSDEKITSMEQWQQSLMILTNQGRIFMTNNIHEDWLEIKLPDLKQSKPRAPAKDTGYSKEFNDLWSKYPKGHCGSKKATSRKFMARLTQAGCFDTEYKAMFNGVVRYALYIEATGYSVKSSETFFGRDRHYTNPFDITDNLKKQSRLKVPYDDNSLVKFASDNGLKKCGNTDTYDQFRRQLRAEIEQRELSAN